MVQFSPDAARLSYKFKGKSITAPVIFATGHALTELEAKWANKQAHSVMGNVLASALDAAAAKALIDAKPEAERKDYEPSKDDRNAWIAALADTKAQETFDKILADYELGAARSRGEGVSRDPATSVARNMAWERIKMLLAKKGIAANSIKAEKRNQLIDQMLEKDPSIMETAKSVVSADSASDGMDDILEGLGNDTTAAPAGTDTVAAPTSGTDTVDAGTGTDTVANVDPTTDGAVPQGVSSDAVSGDAAPSTDTPADPVGGDTEIVPNAAQGEKAPKKAGGQFG